MFDQQGRYIIRNYSSKPPFSSFLPGIAGELGVPLWCYYNNRGQAVCSFGAQDKDHSIMEFSPAHTAYRDVSRTGFRTFCKVGGSILELFTAECDMYIGMSELEITCQQNGLRACAVYFGIPDEPTAALARIFTVTNTTQEHLELELLDGMSAVVPYGLNQDFMKNMTQLSKAWMQCEDHEIGQAYFRVRASLEDGAIVREVKGGNFCLGFDENGTILHPIVQPSLVFGYDTSLSEPLAFRNTSLSQLVQSPQITSNQFLCCFLPKILVLAPGQSTSLFSIYGQALSKDAVKLLAQTAADPHWFSRKREAARQITRQLTDPIACKTADPVFDAYARQSYLDNALRGGAPFLFRNGKKTVPFHLYSRKHGDPEREYNYFSLGNEYYAQGNGNYRDVNQNRRCDVLFAPEIKDANIFSFFDLVQTDGYNPLVILPCTYRLSTDTQTVYAKECPSVAEIIKQDFTPGQLAMAAEKAGMPAAKVKEFTARVICDSFSEPNAAFGEGYWCDHWTYNLDLIDTFLSVYPERKEALLFTENTCRWYDTKVLINPRSKRYSLTENGLRQYFALDEQRKQSSHKWMHTADQTEARSALIEKLILLCTLKTATLDARGMGIEMEGGRPGWYDALNGLPGLLGSSMAESCELARLLQFTADALEEKNGAIPLYEEIANLLLTVDSVLQTETDPFRRWEVMNSFKEDYRLNTIQGFSGRRVKRSRKETAQKLRRMERVVLSGIQATEDFAGGLLPTYFTYEATEVLQTEEGPMPGKLEPTVLPLFLEGPVRYLKLPLSKEKKQQLVRNVKDSALYDRKLRMYKVNESLKKVSFEAGRALAFTPGWLENESVWLHMEYKYFLELLKNGMYTDFSQAFHDAAVPFLDPGQYGRSPLENVSFIASSANPDSSIHGQGFVARLSGSTAEFLHIWQILFFGIAPFRWDGKRLSLQLDPCIPDYLMPDDRTVSACFLGNIPVTYHAYNHDSLIPGITTVASYTLTYQDGHTECFHSSILGHAPAIAVREGYVTSIQVNFQ